MNKFLSGKHHQGPLELLCISRFFDVCLDNISFGVEKGPLGLRHISFKKVRYVRTGNAGTDYYTGHCFSCFWCW